MATHGEIQKLLPYLDYLPPDKRQAVEEHLANCPVCAAAQTQLRASPTGGTPGPDRAAPAPRPKNDSGSVEDGVIDVVVYEEPRRTHVWWARVGAGCALALALLIGAYFWLREPLGLPGASAPIPTPSPMWAENGMSIPTGSPTHVLDVDNVLTVAIEATQAPDAERTSVAAAVVTRRPPGGRVFQRPRASPAPASYPCPVTPATDGRYEAEDGKLWALFERPAQIGGQEVLWWRAASPIIVTGRRLDASVAPLHVDLPCCYSPGYYQTSTLTIPTVGCWEITATAGDSSLRLVTEVYQILQSNTPSGGGCDTLTQAVGNAEAIVEAQVVSTESDGLTYAWQTVRPLKWWKQGASYPDPGETFPLLQELARETALVEGRAYLLFLQQAPWQIFCPERTLAQIIFHEGARSVVGVDGPNGFRPIWTKMTLEAVQAEVQAALGGTQ